MADLPFKHTTVLRRVLLLILMVFYFITLWALAEDSGSKSFWLLVGPLELLFVFGLLFIEYQGLLREKEKGFLQQQQQLERKLNTLIGNLPGMAYRCHNDGGDWVMEYISEGAFDLTGFRSAELQVGGTQVFGELIHPEDQELVAEGVAAGNRGKRRFHFQYRLRRKEGGYVWVWEQGILVQGEDGTEMLEGFICNIDEQKQLEQEKLSVIADQERVLSELKRLQGIIPVCAHCKKVRTDDGDWQMLEAYIQEHSEAEFSHGICPECMKELYPEYDFDLEE